MFYASFVLNKKGPLARIWLAAHWDKKLTKTHVYETDINSSVEVILQPKVKMALRTSGHLLLGVVRIFSRKAKYLLADCNEAFVKIKMAFRPDIVDLPEDGREAAIAAITLTENFHDFDTFSSDLESIDFMSQLSKNQSRPEDITIKDCEGITDFIGDDEFGDVEFYERNVPSIANHVDVVSKLSDIQITRHKKSSTLHIDESLINSAHNSINLSFEEDKNNSVVSIEVDQEFFADSGGLFEYNTLISPSTNIYQEVVEAAIESPKPIVGEKESTDNAITHQEACCNLTASSTMIGEQTTLVHNEQDAFALEPLDITAVPGAEKRGKRKRKLVVDEEKNISPEVIRLQMSDTSDIISTLNLAPPTKRHMLWKETENIEKKSMLSGKPIISNKILRYFTRNLSTKPVCAPKTKTSIEIVRRNKENSSLVQDTCPMEIITEAIENASMILQANLSLTNVSTTSAAAGIPIYPSNFFHEDTSNNITNRLGHVDANYLQAMDHNSESNLQSIVIPADHYSAANSSIYDHSLVSLSALPLPDISQSVVPLMTFNDLEKEQDLEWLPENKEQDSERLLESNEQEEISWKKRTQQMQHVFEKAFIYSDTLSFKQMGYNQNRKQAASRFYTLLVLNKFQAVCTKQEEPFGDILITKGPNFGNSILNN